MALVSATGALVLAKRALSGGWLEWLRKQGSSLLGWGAPKPVALVSAMGVSWSWQRGPWLEAAVQEAAGGFEAVVWAAAAVGSSAAAGSSAAVGAAGESDASVVAAGEADGEGA